MFVDSDIVLSCAPKWLHPEPETMQWRDHWMQSVYYVPETLYVKKREEFVLKVRRLRVGDTCV